MPDEPTKFFIFSRILCNQLVLAKAIAFVCSITCRHTEVEIQYVTQQSRDHYLISHVISRSPLVSNTWRSIMQDTLVRSNWNYLKRGALCSQWIERSYGFQLISHFVSFCWVFKIFKRIDHIFCVRNYNTNTLQCNSTCIWLSNEDARATTTISYVHVSKSGFM